MFVGLAAVGIRAFLAVDGGAAEFTPPEPSRGTWSGDDAMGAEWVRPNEPTVFMPGAVASSTGSGSNGAN
jgi:hypothetical protein